MNCILLLFFLSAHCKSKFKTYGGEKYKDETQTWTHSYAHLQKGLEMLKRTSKGDSQPWLLIKSSGSIVSTDAQAPPQATDEAQGLDSGVTGSVGPGGGAGLG